MAYGANMLHQHFWRQNGYRHHTVMNDVEVSALGGQLVGLLSVLAA